MVCAIILCEYKRIGFTTYATCKSVAHGEMSTCEGFNRSINPAN